MRDGSTYSQRDDVDAAYTRMMIFEFIFITHLSKKLLGLADSLCNALEGQTQHIQMLYILVKITKNAYSKVER